MENLSHCFVKNETRRLSSRVVLFRRQDTQTIRSEGHEAARNVEQTVTEYGHWLLSLGLMYVGNKALDKATTAAGISFPSPLIGIHDPASS